MEFKIWNKNTYTRVKTIKERIDCLKKHFCFEIGALLHSLYRRVKKRANLKTNKGGRKLVIRMIK